MFTVILRNYSGDNNLFFLFWSVSGCPQISSWVMLTYKKRVVISLVTIQVSKWQISLRVFKNRSFVIFYRFFFWCKNCNIRNCEIFICIPVYSYRNLAPMIPSVCSIEGNFSGKTTIQQTYTIFRWMKLKL